MPMDKLEKLGEIEKAARQRLAELEKEHATAIKKLQRAERSKQRQQRRKTFHGYTRHSTRHSLEKKSVVSGVNKSLNEELPTVPEHDLESQNFQSKVSSTCTFSTFSQPHTTSVVNQAEIIPEKKNINSETISEKDNTLESQIENILSEDIHHVEEEGKENDVVRESKKESLVSIDTAVYIDSIPTTGGEENLNASDAQCRIPNTISRRNLREKEEEIGVPSPSGVLLGSSNVNKNAYEADEFNTCSDLIAESNHREMLKLQSSKRLQCSYTKSETLVVLEPNDSKSEALKMLEKKSCSRDGLMLACGKHGDHIWNSELAMSDSAISETSKSGSCANLEKHSSGNVMQASDAKGQSVILSTPESSTIKLAGTGTSSPDSLENPEGNDYNADLLSSAFTAHSGNTSTPESSNVEILSSKPSTPESFHIEKQCLKGRRKKKDWIHLFEESLPRRSPRLLSLPDLMPSEYTFSYFTPVTSLSEKGQSIVKGTSKQAKTDTKKPKRRSKTDIQATVQESSMATLRVQPSSKGCEGTFQFPKPESMLWKTGGPYGVVVDFSLPDKDFAKLKLAKIKNSQAFKKNESFSMKREVQTSKSEKVPLKTENTCTYNSYRDVPNGWQDQVQQDHSQIETSNNEDSSNIYREIPKSPTCSATSNNNSDSTHTFEFELSEYLPLKDGTSSKLQVESNDESERDQSENENVMPLVCENIICKVGNGTAHVQVSQPDNISDVTPSPLCEDNSAQPSPPIDNEVPTEQIHEHEDLCITATLKEKTMIQQTETNGTDSANLILEEEKSVILLQEGSQIGKTNYTFSNGYLSPAKSEDGKMEFSSSCRDEPQVGAAATPYGKATGTQGEGSSTAAMFSCESDASTFTPVLMQACLQHANEDESAVVSICQSTYEVPGVVKMKRDVIAVCLPHWIILWICMPGLEWTVLQTWSLDLEGCERFHTIDFLPVKTYLVLFAGGEFSESYARVYGYSENMSYDFELLYDDIDKVGAFSTVCVLGEKVDDHSQDKDVEFVVCSSLSSGEILLKWMLDSLCLNIKKCQKLPMPENTAELGSLCTVENSRCLLIGTTNSTLLLWNYKRCDLLKSINLSDNGVLKTSCLHAESHMGVLFLTISNEETTTKMHSDVSPHPIPHPCSLYAVNPKNHHMACLQSFCFPIHCSSRRQTAWCANSQYVISGQSDGWVCLWNKVATQSVHFPVFHDGVCSISFHPNRPLVAFGDEHGCVHLYSLC